MELTEQQIDFIRQDIRDKGITIDELNDSLVDHICCALEDEPEPDFEQIYMKVIDSFGKGGLKEIQIQTIYQLTLKKEIVMKKSMYLFLYFAVILCTTGVLFKMMHWPFAGIMLIASVAIFNFGFLPIFFIDKYKKAVS